MDTRLLLGVMVTLMGTALGNPDWSVTVEYGKSVILSCNDTNAPPITNVERWRWMLPDLKIVDHPWVDDDDGLRNTIEGGYRLNVTMVKDRDFGIYHCMHQKKDGGYFVVKRGINVGGPYYGNLWEKYRMSVIIGGSAAGGFAAVMILICLVYKFRWRPPVEEDHHKTGQIDGYGVTHIYDTPGPGNKDDIERIPMSQYNTEKEKNGDVPATSDTAKLTNEVQVKDTSSYVYDNPAMKVVDPDKLTQL